MTAKRHVFPAAARGAGLALVIACLAGCGPQGGLDAVAAAMDPYARPGRLVQLADGRQLNLRCSGKGSPTVVLEAGYGASSAAWSKVQPQVARTTRVCAYDRASAGFSDPGPLPRDGAAIARDLDQGLAAAGIEGPYIIVGHSAGALYGRLFAARRIGEVQGLILLDPTLERVEPQPAGDGLDGPRRRRQRCLAATEAKPQPPLGDARWQGCLPARQSEHGLAVARRPDTWRNQLSELDAIFGRTSQAVIRMGGLLEEIPAYVITASDTAAAAPQIGVDPPKSLAELRHERLSWTFRRGSQQTVLSSHLVMVDRPDVVIAAIAAMVEATRAGRPPPTLPPNETDPPRPDDPFAPEDEAGDAPPKSY